MSRLWDVDITQAMFRPLIDYNLRQKPRVSNSSARDSSPKKNEASLSLSKLRKVIDKASQVISNSDSLVITGNPENIKHLNVPEVGLISSVCGMYASTLTTMTQIRLEILTGLCYNEALIKDLWTFLSNLDDKTGLITFLELITINPSAAEIHILTLFCECTTHLIT